MLEAAKRTGSRGSCMFDGRSLRQPGAAGRGGRELSLNASSPYSASKAASDLLVRSYFITFKLPW